MQFLQINLAKMRGNRVVKVAGEPYVAIPMANLYAASRDAIYANFIMNETTSYGHTFVVSERRRQDGERMPIIGNASPYAPMSKDDAEVVPDSDFSPNTSIGRPATPAPDHDSHEGADGTDKLPFDPETGEVFDSAASKHASQGGEDGSDDLPFDPESSEIY